MVATESEAIAVPLGDRSMKENVRTWLLAYGTALPALAIGTIVRWQLGSVLGQRALYSTFFPAVMIAAYFGGLWPGLVVTFVATLVANAMVDPRLTLQFKGPGDTVAMLLFLLTSTIISGLSESLHRARCRIVADERRLADEELRETKARFRSLVQNSSDIISLFDAEGTVVYQSPSVERLLGHRPQDRVGKNVFRDPIVHPESLATKRAFFDAIRSWPGAQITAEFRLRHADGSWRDIEAIGQNFLADPSVAGIVTNYRDITERKRLEDELRQANARLDLAVRGSNIGIWDIDMPDGDLRNGRRYYVNIWEQLGHQCPDPRSDYETGTALIDPDDRASLGEAMRRYLTAETSAFETETRVRHKDGSYRCMLTRGVAVRDARGRPIRFLGSSVDITDLKRAESELRISEQRFRTFVDHATDAFFLFDDRNVVLDVNRQACERLGYAREELLGMTPKDFDPDAPPTQIPHKLDEKETLAFEARHRRKDGTVFPVEIRGQAFWEGGRRFTVCLARDITERQRAQEAVRRLAMLLRLSYDAIVVWKVDGGIESWSRGAEQLYGFAEAEALGRVTHELLRTVHPVPWPEIEAKLRAGGSWEGELRHRTKDGREVVVHTRHQLVCDDDGVWRVLESNHDITERKRAERELRQAKEAAEAANRAKDEFLANVSHEIRTPMNAILGMTELVLDTPLGDDQRQSLRTVKSAADNLLGIINDLLDFSKIEAGRLELDAGDFSLRAAVGDTLRALAVRAHRKGLELVCNVQPGVPDALVGDAGRLRQVLLNLVGNAIKFTETGEVVVQVENAEGPVSAPDGNVGVRFAVRDTGIGIPPEKRSTIFRAFEQEDSSTTRKYGGTGLGLTISVQLVALMGGRITVESQPGRGSTFSFTARFKRQAQEPVAVNAAPPVLLHNLRVLVVDDNAVNRQIMEQWLRDWQMEPTAVGDGMAAMDVLWHGVAVGKPHALLLLDARMPDTDGMMLAAKIRERAELSGSRIVLLTSGDRPSDAARFREVRVDGHLIKPVQQDELLQTIYSIMSRTGCGDPGPARSAPHADPARATLPAVAPLRVLVAEDSEFNAQLMEKLLVKRGHTVRLVGNGRDALALANARDFDLLLLDVHMPELDGFQVIGSIREHERGTGSHLPVIALTARSRKEDREHCLAAGMDDFLAKPIQADHLWATIDRVMAASPSTERAHTGLLDAGVLLAACGGDGAILRAICEGLRTNVPGQLSAIQDALESQNALRLRESAHKLCGMVAAFSTVAGRIASDLEECSARGQLVEARPIVDEIEAVCRELMQVVAGDLTVEALRRAAGDVDGVARPS
jgi:PAS domain S-box-containing protein